MINTRTNKNVENFLWMLEANSNTNSKNKNIRKIFMNVCAASKGNQFLTLFIQPLSMQTTPIKLFQQKYKFTLFYLSIWIQLFYLFVLFLVDVIFSNIKRQHHEEQVLVYLIRFTIEHLFNNYSIIFQRNLMCM